MNYCIIANTTPTMTLPPAWQSQTRHSQLEIHAFPTRKHGMYVLYHATTGWPKACHTLAHGVPWVYNMSFKIWLKACHITYPRFSVGGNKYIDIRRCTGFVSHGTP